MAQKAFEFVPAQAGTWTHAIQDLQTCNEEAAHATVAALMGLEILEVRMDRPDIDVAGQVLIAGLGTEQVSRDQDLDNATYRRLLAVLAGPVFLGRWPTGSWPLDEAEPGDIGYAARLCKWLKFGLVELYIAECRVKRLLEDRAVCRALTSVGHELLEHGAIPGARVYELVAEADVDKAAVKQFIMRDESGLSDWGQEISPIGSGSVLTHYQTSELLD